MNMAGEPRVRILIVDDHPMVREGLRGMLSTASNLEVVGEAGTAHDAVAQAQALQPDVILLDIQLPDMDGVTALPQLKSVAATARVLMVTMHEETAYMLQAVMAGAAGYILKGVHRQELLTAIQTAVAGHTVAVPVLLGPGRHHGVAAPLSPPQTPCPTDALRPVERELLGLLARGLSNKDISVQMHWSLSTVKKYVQRLFALLKVRDRTQAVAEAMRRRLID
jgi:DNA-binding NarL/FixJ family response regulator